MKNLKNIVALFALVAMLTSPIFSQNTKKPRCKDEQCVRGILKNLDSNDTKIASYAEKYLDSLVLEAKMTGDTDIKNALLYSIIPYIDENPENKNAGYLLSLLPVFCNNRDANMIFKLTHSGNLADKVIRTIGEIPGSDEIIVKCIDTNRDDLQHKAALAYAVGRLNIQSKENELVSWIKTADNMTKIEIYKALLVVKSSDKTASIIEKGAKKLNKSENTVCKIAGMQILTALKGEKAMPMLYKALKSHNCDVRREALELMKPFVNEKVVKNVVKKCKEDEAAVDVLNWLGDIKNNTQMEFVLEKLQSTDKKVVEASIRAIFKIDDAEGINAVKPMFGGEYQEVIIESMATYEGDYRAVMNDVMKGDDKQKLAALQIIEIHPTVDMNRRVQELFNSGNQAVRDNAYKVFKLISIPANADFLKATLEICSDKYVGDVQLAIKHAMKDVTDDKKDLFASTLKHVKPEKMPRFYKVFAYFDTEMCIDKLIDAYQNGEYKTEAKEALLMVDNEKFAKKINDVLK